MGMARGIFDDGLSWFLWLAVWMAFPYDRLRPRVSDPSQAELRSIWLLLGERNTWAFSVAKFLTDTIWWFYLYWLPKFFSIRFGLTIGEMALPLTAVYLAASAGSIGGGALSGILIRTHGSLNFGRKIAMLVCALCALPGCVRFCNSASLVGNGGDRTCCGGTSGLVGQPLHHAGGHVS